MSNDMLSEVAFVSKVDQQLADNCVTEKHSLVRIVVMCLFKSNIAYGR